MRLDGRTVADTARETGLSAPTVSAAFKAFREGGWEAVAVRRRGRRTGQGRSIPAEAAEAMRQRLIEPFEGDPALWSVSSIRESLKADHGVDASARAVRRWLEEVVGSVPEDATFAGDRGWERRVRDPWAEKIAQAKGQVLRAAVGRAAAANRGLHQRFVLVGPKEQVWVALSGGPFDASRLIRILEWIRRRFDTPVGLQLQGIDLAASPRIHEWRECNRTEIEIVQRPPRGVARANRRGGGAAAPSRQEPQSLGNDMTTLTHLQRLEAESIHIMREVVAETENPVMLYSIGKDSAVMLHLARKAFAPGPPPFPLMHIDTRWKFRAMYEFRDRMAEEVGMDLLVHVNPEAIEKDINPFTHGSAIHTEITKTEGLKQALDKYGFDAAFGGARRDEEKSRAKERVFSFRTAQHRWDPKNQRPELWKLYNARKHKGESIRVFPLSNWTELDIWQYIYLENIPIVPLYYSAERPVVERDGTLIMVDDERMPLNEGEVPMMKKVRFRTLGCYPLTGAIESEADTLTDIIQEMLLTNTSERQGRVIDHDSAASMEKKKQEGYF